jgi:cell division septation protein DedD
MEKLDKHISELLNEHDCVIVPEFGGFVANYAPAKIHPVQHTFTPPSKNIVFNKNLKNNDGLLANHIVITEQSTYPQALKYIQHFVDNASGQLKQGKKVKIEEVGTLFLDVERNIQFEPDRSANHLLDAFGLAQFQSPAIKRDNISKRIEKEFKDRDAIPAERKKINIKRYVALAIAMPLLFGMIWIPLKTDLLKKINYSDLNPFSSKEVVKPLKKTPDTSASVKIVIPKDTLASVISSENTPPEPVTATLIEPVKADTTHVSVEVNVDPNNKYHIVAGCFAIEENAIKFVASLQQQNLNAAILGKNNKGLYVVSCGDYATRKEANEELNNLRKLQPNAWLYKN